jgi:nucleotide-binding universal stress UspA family protein
LGASTDKSNGLVDKTAPHGTVHWSTKLMLVDHLAAHGVKAEHISDSTNAGDLTAVEALFANLDTQDADLIVAGAFGHSRIYEGLFGGVMLDLMHQQSLPVLMSH